MQKLEAIQLMYQNKRDEVLRRQAEMDTLMRERADAVVSLAEAEQDLRVRDAALVFLRELSEAQQESMRQKVSSLVTYGLRTVFETDIEFTVTTDTWGNQVTMGFAIKDASGQEVELMEAEGGGLVVLSALLLRIVMLLIHRPRLRALLVADEPLTELSECYREPAADLLRRLVDKGLLRLLFVTHDSTLAAAADTRYRTSLKAGETILTSIGEGAKPDDGARASAT